MPTESDQIVNRNFGEIFSGGIRYEVPFFQRGYVWNKRQWDTLKQDVEEQILAPMDKDDFAAQEHFFGPVVVLEKTGGRPQIKTFQVIDGQQRITTVYLMLAYIRRQIEKHSRLNSDTGNHYYQQLSKWVVNDVDDTERDDYWKMKVFSTKGDRFATYRAVFGEEENPRSPTVESDKELYVPGDGNIASFDKWLGRRFGHRKQSVTKLWQWAKAITECLKVVWIPLGRKDDPQAIFESLNDKGMPLTAAELLCNYLFKPLIDEKTRRHEKLHSDQWLKAQRKLNDKKSNTSFEEYLRHLFSIGETEVIGTGRRVYVSFKYKHRDLDSNGAEKHLKEIESSADLYIQITDPSHGGPHASLLEKIRETNMTSCRPFLLSVLQARQDGSLEETDAESIMREAYILLVRRKIAMAEFQIDRSFFPALLEKIKHKPNKVRAMHKVIQESQLWVSDQDFEDAFTRRAIYRRRETNFTQLILREIDSYMTRKFTRRIAGLYIS